MVDIKGIIPILSTKLPNNLRLAQSMAPDFFFYKKVYAEVMELQYDSNSQITDLEESSNETFLPENRMQLEDQTNLQSNSNYLHTKFY